MLVNSIRHGRVCEREGVGILTQGRRRVGVTKTRLGLQDLVSFDEERSNVVTQPMQRCSLDASALRKSCKSVPECSGRDSRSMVEFGAEQPDTEESSGCRAPFVFESVPQSCRRNADCQRSASPGFWSTDRVSRSSATDVQDPVTEICELQCSEFTASSAAVRRETNDEQILFSKVTTLPVSLSATIVCNCFEKPRFSCGEQLAEACLERSTRVRSCRTAHRANRMRVDDPFVVGPTNRCSQCPKTSRHDGRTSARRDPSLERRPQKTRCQRHDPCSRRPSMASTGGRLRSNDRAARRP